MRDQVQAILWVSGTWLFFFFIRFMKRPAGWIEAAVFASIILLFVFAVIGVLYMFAQWMGMGEEKSKYDGEIEEAKVVARMGLHIPDILLPGFEYCNVSGFRSDNIWDIEYFSVNDKRVEKSEIFAPQGEGWIAISYWNDQESNAALFYRKIKK